MAKRNDDFFIEKKLWSTVKDELLGCYFKPYVAKILHTRKPLIYVDCFAGKGVFEDRNPGSPIIALDIINDCLKSTQIENAKILSNFIDLNYATDLHKNLSRYKNANIVSGKFGDNIERILENKHNWNVFLYIDPYGIKALQCSMFDRFSNGQFNSIELLINMNSFGFIREACHALGVSFDDESVFKDLVEYDSTKLDASEKSISDLNEIAGGEYWQKIIVDYKNKKIDGYEAEKLFANQYCIRLMKSYKYVLNMPLRLKNGHRPKYRLIHATNHKDGCLLMVDNMCNRWEALQEIQTGGQMCFWNENAENQIIDEDDIQEKVTSHFSKYKCTISLYEALADFFINYGAICPTGKVKDILLGLEKNNKIEINRNPNVTEKGRATKFMEENKNQSILIRWIS